MRDVEVHSAPIVLQGKKVLYSIVHDISARRKAEWELKDSEERYRKLSREFQALLDAIPDNLAFLSPDLKIRWVNRVAFESMEKDASEVVGNSCHEFLARKVGAVRGVSRPGNACGAGNRRAASSSSPMEGHTSSGRCPYGMITERWCPLWRWGGT